MAMRASTRDELGKLRELVRHLLVGVRCYFCHELLLRPEDLAGERPGTGRGRPFRLWLSEHHLDGDATNNAIENRVLGHGRCHRRYHLERQRAQGLMRRASAPDPLLTPTSTGV